MMPSATDTEVMWAEFMGLRCLANETVENPLSGDQPRFWVFHLFQKGGSSIAAKRGGSIF